MGTFVGRLVSRAGMVLLLVGAGLAGAQYAFTQFSLAGRSVQSVTLYGAEYAGTGTLSRLVAVTESDGVARVDGLGHVLLLPIDEDRQRATTAYNTVQLDALRVKAPTATRVDGKLLIPLATLARGLGATYAPGQFSLAPAVLSGVSSLAGKQSDRLVFTLNRNVTVREELVGNALRLTLVGASASTRNYTTRGAFVPRVQVTGDAGGARVTLLCRAAAGTACSPCRTRTARASCWTSVPAFRSACPPCSRRSASRSSCWTRRPFRAARRT